MSNEAKARAATVLGIEAGATRTVALLARGSSAERLETGPANLRLICDAALLRLFREIRSWHRPDRLSAVAIGMAGARTPSDRERIRVAASQAWPGVPCRATNDLETGLAAAPATSEPSAARVLILSGTGSCCFGIGADGRHHKVGGWGHQLGDAGSGYHIGLQALRAIVHRYDCDGRWPHLGQRILATLLLNEPEDLIGWVQSASKPETAALAIEVFRAASRGDRLAAEILDRAGRRLAEDAVTCAHRLVRGRPRVQFVLAGSVLLKQPAFAKRIAALLRERWAAAAVTPLVRESAWGAVELARTLVESGHDSAGSAKDRMRPQESSLAHWVRDLGRNSPTEQRNPRSMALDQLPIAQAIKLALAEDARLPAAIAAEQRNLERAIRLIVSAFRRGGRLFYAGAGTSGRLGVLDASECPPTFSVSPEMVQGIMAGGPTALWRSVEGAEDDAAGGARAVGFRGVTRRDVLVGIAASGRTPFVWGALNAAKQRGVATILVCCNPHLRIPRVQRPTLVIAPNTGPEILTGSTRLKAGTATKLILNLLTTLSMVRLGKVASNLMIDVTASNAKLRDRALRIVRELTGVEEAVAQVALEKSGWVVKAAVARLKRR